MTYPHSLPFFPDMNKKPCISVHVKQSTCRHTLKSIDAKPSAKLSFLWFSSGLFITASVILSSTCSICSLQNTEINSKQCQPKKKRKVIIGDFQEWWRNNCFMCIRISHWPCLCIHCVLHDHVPVDAENTLAHLNLVFQEFSYILAWLQQENIGWVGQEHLDT